MTEPITCPIPQVASALRPYIRPRQEVFEIRKSQTCSLRSNIPSAAPTSITTATLALPSVSELNHENFLTALSSISISASSISPLHKDYLAAVRAYASAQEKYSQVFSSLSSLTVQSDATPTERQRSFTNPNSDPITQHVSSLLTARAQHRLDTLSRALEQLQPRVPIATDISDVKAQIRSALGDAPLPPVNNFSVQDNIVGADDEIVSGTEADRLRALVSKMKRSIIQARAAAAEAGRERDAAAESVRDIRIPEDVKARAVERARQMLVTWIEEQLARAQTAEEAEAELLNGDNSFNRAEGDTNGHHNLEDHHAIPTDEVHARVGEMYQRYVSARRELVEKTAVTMKEHSDNQTEQGKVQMFSPTAMAENSATSVALNSTNPVTGSLNNGQQLLQLLPTLLQAHRMTSVLVSQTGALRQNLNSAVEVTKSSITRLAGESQLVVPGSISIDAWVRASKEAQARNAEAVGSSLSKGWESIEGARSGLRGWGIQKGVGLELQKDD